MTGFVQQVTMESVRLPPAEFVQLIMVLVQAANFASAAVMPERRAIITVNAPAVFVPKGVTAAASPGLHAITTMTADTTPVQLAGLGTCAVSTLTAI